MPKEELKPLNWFWTMLWYLDWARIQFGMMTLGTAYNYSYSESWWGYKYRTNK